MKNKSYDDISAADIYAWAKDDQHAYLDGEFREVFDDKYTYSPGQIEDFVNNIARTDKLGFEWKKNRKGKNELRTLPLGNYFNILFDSYLIDSEKHTFSEKVELFYRSLRYLDLNDHQKCSPNTPFLDSTFAVKFNQLITLIRTELNSPDFKKRLKDRAANARRNFNSADKYIETLFSAHARLLVLRVDFGYKKDPGQAPSPITLKQAREDLRHFFNNKRGKSFLSSIKGYIWKLEYGVTKGYHYHLIIFYEGSEHCKDVYLATQICKYWNETITNGQGTSHNCNLEKRKYKFLGIGPIHHTDAATRDVLLLKVVAYLTKSEQYIRVKDDEKLRVFQRGMMPKKIPGKPGRPRKKNDHRLIEGVAQANR